MPIGKSAIKRVADNGYSKVKTAAPDMQNSTVVEKVDSKTVEKLPEKEPAKKPAPKKTAAAKPAAKKPAAKKPAAKAAPKVEPTVATEPNVKKAEKDGFVRFGLGQELPEYLL